MDLRGTVFPSSNQSNPSKHVTWDYPKTALPWQKNIEYTSSYYTSFWNLANDCHTSCLGLVKSATLWMCTAFWRLPAWTRPAACSSTCHQNAKGKKGLGMREHLWRSGMEMMNFRRESQPTQRKNFQHCPSKSQKKIPQLRTIWCRPTFISSNSHLFQLVMQLSFNNQKSQNSFKLGIPKLEDTKKI